MTNSFSLIKMEIDVIWPMRFKNFWPELQFFFVIPGHFMIAKFVPYLIKYPNFNNMYLMLQMT